MLFIFLFFYFIVLVYYSLIIKFVIVWAAKIGKFREGGGTVIIIQSDNIETL